jgi:hypothetical protein
MLAEEGRFIVGYPSKRLHAFVVTVLSRGLSRLVCDCFIASSSVGRGTVSYDGIRVSLEAADSYWRECRSKASRCTKWHGCGRVGR